MFRQFIDCRVEMRNTGQGHSDEFELEIVKYADRIERRKPYKEFFRNVKDKVCVVTVV